MALKKELGLFEAFAIAAGAMISSGLFVLPGIAFAKAGPAMIYAYLLAGLFVVPAMLAKAELATAMPRSGGVYFFVDRSMGVAPGTLAGMASWFSLSFKSAFALIGIGAFAVLVNPAITELQIKLIAVIGKNTPGVNILYPLISILMTRAHLVKVIAEVNYVPVCPHPG